MLPRYIDTTSCRRGFSKLVGRVAKQKQMHRCGRATSGSVTPVSTLLCGCLRDMHGSGAQPPMPSRPFHHTKQDNAAGLVTPPCPASQASARALTVRTAGGCYWSGELMLLLDSSGTSHKRRFVRLRRSPVARPFEHNALAAAGLCYLHCSMPTAILLGF
jgi:hypothetical protein